MVSEQTHTCPNCGYEYHAWVEVCPDCGARLEDKPKLEVIEGKLDRSSDPRWTIVTNVPNAILGNLLKSQIEDAGIPVLMVRSRSADIAEFSHNDYVPHDILVPYDLRKQARAVVDGRPSGPYDSSYSSPFDREEDGLDVSSQASNLPEGWAMLPTEQDLRAFQQIRRSHGDRQDSWQWTDDTDPRSSSGAHAYDYEPEDAYSRYDDYDTYDPDLVTQREPAAYGRREYGQGWSGSPRWVKVVYGVLMLALSLPFLMRLLDEAAAMFGRR